MRILITGSSGQIGTNLALLLEKQGHYVFGVDKRPNTWTNEIETLLQDLSTPYRNFKGGIGHVEYPKTWTLWCIWRRTPKCMVRRAARSRARKYHHDL